MVFFIVHWNGYKNDFEYIIYTYITISLMRYVLFCGMYKKWHQDQTLFIGGVQHNFQVQAQFYHSVFLQATQVLMKILLK